MLHSNGACLITGGRGEEIVKLGDRNVTDGQWHSVRVKRDGKRFKMILDGGGVPGTMVSFKFFQRKTLISFGNSLNDNLMGFSNHELNFA